MIRYVIAVVAMLSAGAALAQNPRHVKYDRDAAKQAFDAADARTKMDTSADAEMMRKAIDAMIAGTSSKSLPIEQMNASMAGASAIEYSSRGNPATYGIVAPGTKRPFVLRVHVASTQYIVPNRGEPYHLAPLETYYPALGVPALQSILSGTWIYKVSAGALSVGTSLEKRYKVSSNLDHYVFDAEYRSHYETGVPGSGAALERWNATVPFAEPAMAQFDLDRREANIQRSRESKRSTPRNRSDAYSILAPGVASESLVYDEGVIIVMIANASTSPFMFAPQDYVYLPGRLLTPMVAQPFRKGPLPMRPAAACILRVLPYNPLRDIDTGPAKSIDPRQAAGMTETQKVQEKRMLRRSAAKLAEVAGLFAGLGGPRLLQMAAGAADTLGKIGDGYELATGSNMITGEDGDRATAAGKIARSKAIDSAAYKKGPVLEGAASATNKQLDINGISNDVDPAEKARDAAEAAQIKQELANHDSAETRRILAEDNARRRAAQADLDVVQKVADTSCASF